MRIAYTPGQLRLQQELRGVFARLVTPEVRAQLRPEGGDAYRGVVRVLADEGWLGMGFPAEWGGQDRPMIERIIFSDEALRAGVALPHLTISTVGPLLAAYGTQEQKERFLPGIVGGRLFFSIGYTEPQAGTDLASLKTRAVRDGDEYVVSGQKVFTSGIFDATHVWLAVRTDDSAPKHRGISVLIVPTDSPGFSYTPLPVIAGFSTSTTYYDDVRVPVDNLVGRENEGWRLITSQLNNERVANFTCMKLAMALDEVTRWAARTVLADGSRVIDAEWVRLKLAEVRARNEVSKLLGWKLAADIDAGTLGPAEAAMNKIYTTENFVEGFHTLLEVIGEASAYRPGSARAPLDGAVEQQYRGAFVNYFGGGANDMLRDFIAVQGLGLPKAAR